MDMLAMGSFRELSRCAVDEEKLCNEFEGGDIALHTVTGRSIRRQKEFEPLRRWRETTKPKPQSKFRSVALTTEVTKCDPRRKLGRHSSQMSY